jgi:hypothetical protein
MNIDWRALGEKAKGLLKTAGEKAVKAATEVRERTDKAATAVATKVTEVTGRETTAGEVKRAAAVVAGAVILGTTAVAVSGAASRRGPGGAVASILGVGSDAGSGSEWGSDFESQMARRVAQLGGSINYYTPHVDSTGTVYSGPNG